MIIKNREELISSSPRARAVELIEAGIERVLPNKLLRTALKYNRSRKVLSIQGKRYNLSRSRVFVIGGGKASGLMAEELEKMLGPDNITAGIVNCKTDGFATEKISIVRAGHPLPDEAGVKGVHSMLAMKARYDIGKGDLVFCLISGGGSALMPCPVSGITLEDQQDITELLLRCGADIKEINTVRKHLSLTKGGSLGKFYEPARVVSLIISDVVGDDLDVIASGPTVPDSSTFKDAHSVLLKYGLMGRAPRNVVDFIGRGVEGIEAETPKELYNCDSYIVGNNRMCLEAVVEKAKDLGLKPFIITSELNGDTTAVARGIAGDITGVKYRGFDVVLLGGETAPTLPENSGKGGRNQHYAAVTMLAMQSYHNRWLVACAGTDGSDFLPDVAGAIVDDRSLSIARSAGIDVEDYINRFDSNTLFNRMGRSLIVTGSTGTNVSDMIIYLLG